jgi:hypothetical protein
MVFWLPSYIIRLSGIIGMLMLRRDVLRRFVFWGHILWRDVLRGHFFQLFGHTQDSFHRHDVDKKRGRELSSEPTPPADLSS